ncbi:MAG TPA: FAD binding domain-containing protein [Microbacterium sp.]|uniref:FAD binding domain-containing protein n=1 Tax=Microbacterium sp. TaxID=51671 RepID=UPI002CAF7481|nr:FAD binding domain-containing protein [Microbacterium sp.]HWI30945.1 FAD binding domain-containing protein [Microbacterium sp.]
MDINTVTQFRRPHSRADLALRPGEVYLAGGTWLYSEPQPGVTGFVDLTAMAWPSLTVEPAGLRIGATCTIAELVALPPQPGWAAQPLFFECATALLASHKIWTTATVGGNVCRSFAAGAMVSLAATLDGTAEVWTARGGSHEVPVADLMTGNGTNSLMSGDVLRSILLPEYALRARTAYRKIALAELGRSGSVVTARVDEDGGAVFVVTAATEVPTVRRFDAIPDPATLRAAFDDVPFGRGGWYTDPLGEEQWRRGVSLVLLGQVRAELAGESGGAGEVVA